MKLGEMLFWMAAKIALEVVLGPLPRVTRARIEEAMKGAEGPGAYRVSPASGSYRLN